MTAQMRRIVLVTLASVAIAVGVASSADDAAPVEKPQYWIVPTHCAAGCD